MNNQAVKTDFSSVFACFGMYALFIVYPLFMNNGYHDITVTRFTFFCIVSSVFALICAIIKILEAKQFSQKLTSVRGISISAVAFLIFSVISTISGEFPLASLYGDGGRYMGLIMYIALIAAFFWISSCYRISERDFEIFSVVALFIFAFSFLQFKGIDVFGLLGTLPFESRINFLSPFGNINVFSGYICIMTPLAMYMSVFSQKKRKDIFWSLCSAGGFAALFIANSDSGYLGILTAFAVLFFCSCKTTEINASFWKLTSLFFLTAIITGITNKLFLGTRGVSDMTMLVTETALPVVGLIVSSIIFIFVKSQRNKQIPKAVPVAFACAVAASVIAVFSAMIYFSVFDVSTPLGYFEKFLRFNDSWGTERGFVWSRLMQIFARSPLKNKLFGFGAETISILMVREFKDDMITLGYFTDNAHNEYLNLLISNGICGLLSYISMLIFALKATLKKDNPLIISALLLPVAAWSAQAIVNISQPISTPFIFIFLALTHCATADYSLVTKINIKRFIPQLTDFTGKEDDIL